jgi:hypothetical protein
MEIINHTYPDGITRNYKEFATRGEVINALVEEFNENPNSFSYNKTATRFWTFNRLIHYYWDIKNGRKKEYNTVLNPETGWYELKKSDK